jgi:hypothetical protein
VIPTGDPLDTYRRKRDFSATTEPRTYDCEKWIDREVKAVLHGERVRGRYVLIKTHGRRWLMRRLDPPR